MKTARNTTVLPPPPLAASPRLAASKSGAAATAVERTIETLLAALGTDDVRHVAIAPGRLDVMGGLAEYSGAMVLGLPLAQHVGVAAQARHDGKVRIAGLSSPNGHADTEFPASALTDAKGVLDPAKGRALLRVSNGEFAVCVLGALCEAIREELISIPPGGVSIGIASAMEELPSLSKNAVVAAATIAACSSLAGHPSDASRVAAACQRVENLWLDTPVGAADAVCALLGEPKTMLQVQGDPSAPMGSLRLSEDVAIVGVDCGAVHEDAAAKYRQVRVATFMGRLLIDRILKFDGVAHPSWDGHLARVTMTDFVEQFRDRIPTKIKGREFLDRFGETGDPLTRIDPETAYKVRSRTEHHVYEHARSQEFVDFLTRAVRQRDRSALVSAGECMFASHWSYGQRCGLGSIETDLLVNLIRRHGAKADIYGAKITGRGGGGMVAVLMERTDRAAAALQAAVEEYSSRTNLPAPIADGGIPGALVTGVQAL